MSLSRHRLLPTGSCRSCRPIARPCSTPSNGTTFRQPHHLYSQGDALHGTLKFCTHAYSFKKEVVISETKRTRRMDQIKSHHEYNSNARRLFRAMQNIS